MSKNPWWHLWADDPALAGPDPLDLHNIDYGLADLAEDVASAWKNGLGYVLREDPSEGPIDAKVEEAQLSEEEL
ncbi:MAG TPA: hypothetical protein HPQ04_00210 [Rhodospirillaceae bacterium]|nr:hypothetical protein [Rhodospirillaceae bacterium]